MSAFRNGNPGTAGMEAYNSIGTLHAIVSRLANSTSLVDWHLYSKRIDGRRKYATPDGSDQRTEITSHAALDLWNHPNDFMTQQEFEEVVQQHLDLTGEGWIVVSKAGSIPVSMWPVRPDRMQIVKDATEYLTGYIYKTPDGDEIPLGVDDVIMLRYPNPMDPYRGISPVQALMVDLDTKRYASQWNRNFFKNNAIPGGIIELPDDCKLTDAEFYEMQDRWREAHQGINNAHRVGIIEYGGKYVESKFAQRDMQFAELTQLSSEIIREAYAFPKPMLGTVDNVNLANAEAGEYVFAKYCLKPRLERWKQMLNNDLLRMYGAQDRLEFDYEDPTPVDQKAQGEILTGQAAAVIALVQAGFDPDESLEVIGLPPIKWNKPEPPPALQQPPPASGDAKDGNDQGAPRSDDDEGGGDG